jgi:ribosomal protein S12 methylthiotransferase
MSKGRFYLDNHGCAKNQVDGEEIAERLEAAGYAWADSADGADFVIVNSCGFVNDAKKESIDAVIGWKSSYPGKKVILAGCLSQRYATELAAGLPEADGLVGNADLSAVLQAADAVMEGSRPVIVSRPEAAPAAGTVRRTRLLDFPGTAHVKITEGCSNRCSYCAIPLIRGDLRSRAVADIVEECAWLVGRGAKELVLIGQDLGAFGKDSGGKSLLPELLAALADEKAFPGDFRVRTLYIHPDNFPDAILPVIASSPRLLPYFDLPFQHASAPVLKAMNRHGSAAAYLDLVARIRKALPDSMIRSTFLVGFPGETEEDFAALRDFQEKAELDWLGAFAYSREEGTAAYGMKGRVAAKTAQARKKAVEEAQERITSRRLARFLGATLDVLVEERVAPPASPEGGQAADPGSPAGQEDEGAEELSLGRAWLQAPEVDGLVVLRGGFEPGSMVKARVLAVNGVDLDALPLKGRG